MRAISILLLLLLFSNISQGQNAKFDQVETYKLTDQRPLTISFLYPNDWNERTDWPVLVFYFGGGWAKGSINQFLPQARYFAGKGMVCALVDYRVRSKDGTDPFASLMDAKSAMRYIKSNMQRHHIDSSKVVASGGSAGGHLAAACELVKGYNDPKDDLSISTKVSALVLFNPVLDNSPDGYGYNRIGEQYISFSPFFQDKKGMADVLILQGTQDKLIPVKTMETFCESVKEAGSYCDLVLYAEAKHGFFNKGHKDGLYYRQTLQEIENFLRARSFIGGEN